MFKGTFAENNVKLESALQKLKKVKQENINTEVRCHPHHDFIIPSLHVSTSVTHRVIGQKDIDLMSRLIACWT